MDTQTSAMADNHISSPVSDLETGDQETTPVLPYKDRTGPKNRAFSNDINKPTTESLHHSKKNRVDIAEASIQRKPDTSAFGLKTRSASIDGDVNSTTVSAADKETPSLLLHHPLKEEAGTSEKISFVSTASTPISKPDFAIDHSSDVDLDQSTVVTAYSHPSQMTKGSRENSKDQPNDATPGLKAHSAESEGEVKSPALLATDNANPFLSLHHPVKEEIALSEKTFSVATTEAPALKPESAAEQPIAAIDQEQSKVTTAYPLSNSPKQKTKNYSVQGSHDPDHKSEQYQVTDHTERLTRRQVQGSAGINRDKHKTKSNTDPRVHIGQIDIVIAAPEVRANPSVGVKDSPATDLASRLYLRNL